MKNKFINDLKALIARFREEKPAGQSEEALAAETPAMEAPAAAATPAETPASEAQSTEEPASANEPPAGEQTAEEFAKPKEKEAIDYNAIALELDALRKKVSVLEEYTYLKDRQTQLESRVTAQGQMFASALELIQNYFELPSADPSQDRKDGFNTKEKISKEDKRNEWAEAFAGLKKKQ